MRGGLLLLLLLLGLAACGGSEPSEATPIGRLPYAEVLNAFDPGPGAGYGSQKLPDVVLGAPSASDAPSLDVVSLGTGGTIVLDFGADREIYDGPGPDLVVFENPFWVGGDPAQPFAELGEVSVSADGTNWHVFPCDTAGSGDGVHPGCAGWTPTRAFPANETEVLNPEVVGGDHFDLAELGVASARFVRVRDLETLPGAPPSAGFDLDAVGAFHLREVP